MKHIILQIMFAVLAGAAAQAQIVTGSNGSDGALDYSSLTNLGYSTNIVINMADHPTGIYQYTYVNIPANVTVTFIPNANNTPVYWLVQSNVVINGTVDVSGQNANGSIGGVGGPGGWAGGSGGSAPSSGQGPGGGAAGGYAVCASYATAATNCNPVAPTYGNTFILPFLGGSGGGGSPYYSGFGTSGGGGGGGAILVATSDQIQMNGGSILASGGAGYYIYNGGIAGGSGSGGAIRLVASQISGTGQINASGRYAGNGYPRSGDGWVRFDTYQNTFSGVISGVFSQGSQFVIIPTSGQLPQLTVTSVGGVPVSASPTGALSTPDAVVSAQQNNPIPIVVNCANLPLGSLITVTVTPMTGSPVSATGYNNTGTLSSSTATIPINIPRGGGLIYATVATGN